MLSPLAVFIMLFFIFAFCNFSSFFLFGGFWCSSCFGRVDQWHGNIHCIFQLQYVLLVRDCNSTFPVSR